MSPLGPGAAGGKWHEPPASGKVVATERNKNLANVMAKRYSAVHSNEQPNNLRVEGEKDTCRPSRPLPTNFSLER